MLQSGLLGVWGCDIMAALVTHQMQVIRIYLLYLSGCWYIELPLPLCMSCMFVLSLYIRFLIFVELLICQPTPSPSYVCIGVYRIETVSLEWEFLFIVVILYLRSSSNWLSFAASFSPSQSGFLCNISYTVYTKEQNLWIKTNRKDRVGGSGKG